MPAFTAVGAYVAGTVFGLVGTAAVVVGALVATGAAYITSRIINGNPNKGNNSAAGSQGGRIQVPPATNNKIPVVYGNAYINGIITDARLISTDQKINDTMYYCIVLSETCNNVSAAYTINDIYWNDLRLTFDASAGYKVKDGRKNVDNPDGVTEDFIDTNFISDNKHLVEVRVYAGSTAAADQIFPTTGTTPAYTYWAGNDGSWDSTYKMDGLVFAIVKVTYNGEKGFTGLPNMTFRMNNSISNPADVWYDYMTGDRYGAGIDSSYIDSTAQTAWANFCDEDITYTDKDGNTNQSFSRYSINGPIDTSRSVKENIDIIMQNAGAWLSYNVTTGLWSPIIKKAVTAGEVGLSATYFTASRSTNELTVTNFPAGRIEAGQLLYNSSGTLIGTIVSQLTPTAGETAGQKGRYTTSTSGSITSTTFYTLPATMLAFSDDNIISGITISSTRLDDLYNSVEAEFYDKHNKDQRAYARNEIDAGDRNPNEPDNQLRMSLDLVNNSMQADLLGQLELRQSRDDLVVEFTTNHYGIQAQAGDVVSVTSELYDWNPKYFRVMRVKEQETEEGGLVAQIQGLEYNPDVYTIEPITEFSTSANIGIGVYAASPNLPLPPDVVIASVDADSAIPNFQLQVTVPTTGGPFDEIELYYTEGWDQHPITGTIVPGTGSNGAAVGQGLLTVTATTYGNINPGDQIDLATDIYIVSQLTNTPASKTFVSGGVPASTTSTLITLDNVTGLIVGNTLTGTGIPNGSFIIEIDSGTNTVRIEDAVTVQAAGTYTVSGGLGTYVVDTSTTQTLTAVDLYDFPEVDNYKLLKKIVPEGNTATFTNGEIIRDVITNVPANSATYRRWFIKARMGIKKRFGAFSNPGNTDFNKGRFPYNPNPGGGGGPVGPLPGVFSSVDINNTTPWLTFSTQPDGVNPKHGIRGRSTLDDYWFVGGASAGDDLGYLEIATADNSGPGESNSGGEIYVRQYNGSGAGGPEWVGGPGTAQRTLTLLDNLGNTIIPQNLTVDSGTLFVDATTNRVGIKNTSPAYELDVTGEIAQTGDNLRLNTDDAGVDVSIWFNSVRTLKWDHGDQRFEFNDDLYVNDNLIVAGSTFLGNNYITDATTVTGDFSVVNNSITNLFVDHTTGYIGINDVTPSYNLDVNGTANIETSLTVPSISTLTGDDLNITAFSGRDLTISTTAAADPVTIVRNLTTTNNSIRTLTVRANSTNTPVIGFGNTLEFETESTPGTFVQSGYIENKSTGDNAGVLDEFKMSFGVMSGGVSTERMVLDNLGNLQIDGNLQVDGNVIKKSSGIDVITFSGTNLTTFSGDIAIGGNTIRDSASTAAIELSGANVTVEGTLEVNGNQIKNSAGNTVVTMSGLNTVLAGTLELDGNQILSSTGATAITLSGATVSMPSDLTVDSGTLKVDASTDRVGVNTTTPTKTLDVNGDTNIGGDVGVGGTLNALSINSGQFNLYFGYPTDPKLQINLNNQTLTGNTTQVLYSYSRLLYRSIKFTMSMTKGTDYHCLEGMIIHDGTTAYITVYNEIFTNASLVTLSADTNDDPPNYSLRILATPTTTGSLKIMGKLEAFELF